MGCKELPLAIAVAWQFRGLSTIKEQLGAVNDLSNDFGVLWNSEFTSRKDRQYLVRVLIARVVVDVVNSNECLSADLQLLLDFRMETYALHIQSAKPRPFCALTWFEGH